MTLHVTVQNLEENVIVIDTDGTVGVRIKAPDPRSTGDFQVMFVDRVVPVVVHEVTTRAIVSYTDPEGIRQQFERDVPGIYGVGGPRYGGSPRAYRITLTE